MLTRDNLPDKQKLRHCVSTSIQTTMIGALASMEKELGELWGNGLEYDKLTGEQKRYRERWESARDRVLQVGERAKKIAIRAVNSHNVQKKPYYWEPNDD